MLQIKNTAILLEKNREAWKKYVKMMPNTSKVCKIILFIDSPNDSPKSCLFGGKIVKKTIFFLILLLLGLKKFCSHFVRKLTTFQKGSTKSLRMLLSSFVLDQACDILQNKRVISFFFNVCFRQTISFHVAFVLFDKTG